MDLMTILLLAVFAFFIFTMFRRNKKAQQQQASLQSKFAPGIEVMTSFGLYGRIVSLDEAENKVVLELSPGNLATVHRQAVTKVVEPASGADAAGTAGPGEVSGAGADAAGADAAGASNAPSSASGISLGKAESEGRREQGHFGETPDETLRRLNDEGKSAN